MSLVLHTGPAGEPVALADIKAFLRVDTSDEDGLINGLISAARMQVEAHAQIALMTQSWTWAPLAVEDQMTFPLSPVQEITSVHALADGASELMSPADYVLSGGQSAEITFTRSNWGASSGASGLSILFKAGFGSDMASVPSDLKHAVMLLVAHWYEQREPAFGTAQHLPDDVVSLLAPYRRVRL